MSAGMKALGGTFLLSLSATLIFTVWWYTTPKSTPCSQGFYSCIASKHVDWKGCLSHGTWDCSCKQAIYSCLEDTTEACTEELHKSHQIPHEDCCSANIAHPECDLSCQNCADGPNKPLCDDSLHSKCFEMNGVDWDACQEKMNRGIADCSCLQTQFKCFEHLRITQPNCTTLMQHTGACCAIQDTLPNCKLNCPVSCKEYEEQMVAMNTKLMATEQTQVQHTGVYHSTTAETLSIVVICCATITLFTALVGVFAKLRAGRDVVRVEEEEAERVPLMTEIGA
eukprot:TRINITY_DN6312_c0_g1_i1.p1 TRINITY_DN6312_c0_g1~~TRINITY_DN6312_c0_g1_i1.p1  ORF type:complete len:282 (-),score=15.34 TRINITY_DN6312_c0_g1_i1:80-925(-)